MLKKVVAGMIALTMAASLAGCGSTSSAEGGAKPQSGAVQIKLAHAVSIQTTLHESFLEFEKLVEEKTNGKYDVVIFPAGQMGSVTDNLEQVRRGDIQMSSTSTTNFVQTIPEFAVWDLMYLFDDEAHAHRVLDGKAGTELFKALNKMGVTGIGYQELGFRQFSNNQRPIVKAEDVQGLKIRGYNPLQIKAWTALGANLTNIAWGELFTSLQQNLIDGQECATTSFFDEKFYEAQKYLSLTRHVYSNMIWYANSEFMDSLPEEDRAIIMECAKKSIDDQRAASAEAEKKILDELPSKGIEVNDVSLEERRKMGEISNAIIKDDIIANCGQQVYDMVMQEIEAERNK